MVLAFADERDFGLTPAIIACHRAGKELRVQEADQLRKLVVEHSNLIHVRYERKLIYDAVDRCLNTITEAQIKLINESASKNWDALREIMYLTPEGLETEEDIKMTDEQFDRHKKLKEWQKAEDARERHKDL